MKGLIIRAALVVVTVAIVPGLTGCGKQMARIEESQLKLQTMVEANAQQIAAIVDYTKQNQHQLQTAVAAIKDVQSGTKKVSADIINLENEQLALQEMVQNNNRQLDDNVAAIEQNQKQLQARIGDIQNGTKKVAADIITLGNEQITLQEMVQSNSRQLTDNAAAIEQNQQQLQARIGDVQNGTKKVDADIIALGNEQITLQEMVQSNSRQLADNAAAIEQNQQQLQARIGDVQNGTKKVDADIIALGNEQITLQEMVQSNSRQLADNAAAIEQKQYERQGRIEGVQKNIQKLANSINVLENNLLKLQEIFQSSTQDLFSIMDIADREQLKFEERIQKHLQALTDSLSAIEQSQAQLQNKIVDVQNSTGVISKNVTAIPEQLEAELFHTGPAQISALAEPATPAGPTEIVKKEPAGL